MTSVIHRDRSAADRSLPTGNEGTEGTEQGPNQNAIGPCQKCHATCTDSANRDHRDRYSSHNFPQEQHTYDLRKHKTRHTSQVTTGEKRSLRSLSSTYPQQRALSCYARVRLHEGGH